MMRLTAVEGASPDKWLRVWRDRHPEAPIDAAFVLEREQWDAIDRGEAELALVRLGDAAGAIDEARKRGFAVELYREKSVAVLPKDHPYADEPELSLADIAEIDRTPIQPSTAETIALTAAGVGICVMPMSVARVHHRKDVVKVPLVDGPEFPVVLVWREDSELIQDFVGVTRGRGANSSR